MGVTTYATVNGILLEENRNGTLTTYVIDTLGSIISTTDALGSVSSEITYWPYGEVRTATGSASPIWGFLGGWGYHSSSGSLYIRLRTYSPISGTWRTVDSLWPSENGYVYSYSSPALYGDFLGTRPRSFTMPLKGDPPAKGIPLPKPVRIPPGRIPPIVRGIGRGVIFPGFGAIGAGAICGYEAWQKGLYSPPDEWNDATRGQYFTWCVDCCKGLASAVGGGIGAAIGAPSVIGIAVGGLIGGFAGHVLGDKICPGICDALLPPVPQPVEPCPRPYPTQPPILVGPPVRVA